MQLFTFCPAAILFILLAVNANPWGNTLLKARDIPQCIDGSGSGCADGPFSEFDNCQEQCYGAEADSGDLCRGACEQIPMPNGNVGPILCFCLNSSEDDPEFPSGEEFS